MPAIKYTFEATGIESCGRHDDAFEMSLTFDVPYSPDGPDAELHLDDVSCLKCELFDRKHSRQSGMALDSHSRAFWEATFADAVRESVNLQCDIQRKCVEDWESTKELESDRQAQVAWKDRDAA